MGFYKVDPLGQIWGKEDNRRLIYEREGFAATVYISLKRTRQIKIEQSPLLLIIEFICIKKNTG